MNPGAIEFTRMPSGAELDGERARVPAIECALRRRVGARARLARESRGWSEIVDDAWVRRQPQARGHETDQELDGPGRVHVDARDG